MLLILLIFCDIHLKFSKFLVFSVLVSVILFLYIFSFWYSKLWELPFASLVWNIKRLSCIKSWVQWTDLLIWSILFFITYIKAYISLRFFVVAKNRCLKNFNTVIDSWRRAAKENWKKLCPSLQKSTFQLCSP